jgi:hypothetical protein
VDCRVGGGGGVGGGPPHCLPPMCTGTEKGHTAPDPPDFCDAVHFLLRQQVGVGGVAGGIPTLLSGLGLSLPASAQLAHLKNEGVRVGMGAYEGGGGSKGRGGRG